MGGLLITGGSGYLGSELLRRAPGAAGTYLTSAFDGGERLDVRDTAAVDRLVDDLRPEAVIHTAYSERGDEAEAINVAGSRNVARAAARAGARLVHVSTDLVFDGALGRPYTEYDEPRPILEYGRQKLAAERAVADEEPGALIARTSLIYGGDDPSRHERLALDAAGGDAEVSFFTDELRSPVQVGDLAAALLELAATAEAGVLHVAGADGISRHEFARLVVAAHGGDPHALRGALAADHPDPRPPDCRLDCSRARARVRTSLRGAREVLGGPR